MVPSNHPTFHLPLPHRNIRGRMSTTVVLMVVSSPLPRRPGVEAPYSYHSTQPGAQSLPEPGPAYGGGPGNASGHVAIYRQKPGYDGVGALQQFSDMAVGAGAGVQRQTYAALSGCALFLDPEIAPIVEIGPPY